MNAASASSYGSTGGGIPVPAGQLTLVFAAFGMSSATSAGGTAAPAPLPAVNETIAGNFAGLQGTGAVANDSDSISALSTAVFASNAKEASPVANAGGSLSASSSLPGTTGSANLINGGNSGGGANLTAIATATIANPAPNSIFLEPDQVSSQPEMITLNPFEGTRDLPGSTLPDAVGVPAPAEATDNAAGEVDIDFSFDVAIFPTDHPLTTPFTEPTVMSAAPRPAQASKWRKSVR